MNNFLMNNFQTFNVGPDFGNFDVFFCSNTYAIGGGLALELRLYPSCEPFGCITVNLPDCPLDPPFVFLDVNNFPGILELMCDNNFSTGAISSARSGFVDYPLVRLNLSRIKEFSI